MKIFTDGSVYKKTGGAAAVSDEGHEWSGFIKTSDNYFAELEGVLIACRNSSDSFCLVSDHMGIVDEIRTMLTYKDWKPPQKAREMWVELSGYKDKLQGVEWMKRCSNPHMKRVDSLAKEAGYER